MTNSIWIGIITNGSRNVSTLTYVDKSPFVNFPDFWKSGEPNGAGSNGIRANATSYWPSSQLNDDIERELIQSIICYKVHKNKIKFKQIVVLFYFLAISIRLQ